MAGDRLLCCFRVGCRTEGLKKICKGLGLNCCLGAR